MLMFDPFDPETTIAFKLLYSVRDFLAEPPVLSRASFRMRFTYKRKQGRIEIFIDEEETYNSSFT
jgi:hypothetical protein